MTNIKLTVTGAQARASVTGPLTSGMVGIPVAIEYDEAWDALTKNLICRCSPWGSIDGENRAILNVGETASVAHEVMLPDRYLYLGLEGFREDGTLVMPTTWACCGKIAHGASTCEDPSTAPSLSVWNQLQVELEQLQEQALTQEQAAEVQACALEARQAAEEAKEAAASADSALTSDERSSLIAIVNAIGTFSVPNGQELMDAFNTAWGNSGDSGGDTTEKTLTSISATYSGGSVPVGTAVSALTGIVVTAHYSDGSTATVTGYTLSGEIAEGENTVTVTYQGMTATFTVTGVAESGGESLAPKEIVSELEWVDGVNMWEGSFNEYGGMRTCKAYDVSGYNLLTIKSNGAHAAPTVGSVKTADATTYTDIPNNEGSAYMGGEYPDTLTYNISGASLIRIKLNSNAAPYSYVLS